MLISLTKAVLAWFIGYSAFSQLPSDDEIVVLTSPPPSLGEVASNRTHSFFEIYTYSLTHSLLNIQEEASMYYVQPIRSFVTSTVLPCLDDVGSYGLEAECIRSHLQPLSSFYIQAQECYQDAKTEFSGNIIPALFKIWIACQVLRCVGAVARMQWEWYLHLKKVTVSAVTLVALTGLLVYLVGTVCKVAEEEDTCPVLLFYLLCLAIVLRVYVWAVRLNIRLCFTLVRFPFRCFADCCWSTIFFLGYAGLNFACMVGKGLPQDVCLLIWIVIQIQWLRLKVVLPLFRFCHWCYCSIVCLGSKVAVWIHRVVSFISSYRSIVKKSS